VLIVFALMKMP